MMKNNKNQCINVSTESYTGKEQSPKRFGLSAEGFDINYEKEGFDKLIWIVQIKNNRKVWVRKNNITTITHEEPIIPDTNIKILKSKNNDDKDDDKKDDKDDEKVKNDEDDKIEDEKVKDDNDNDNDDEKVKEDDSSSKPEKKKTDYNIFLKYYLNKLKEKEDNKLLAHKVIFQMAIQEWARLKKNPTELKKLIETIKIK
jgi:hypothetical protein